MPLSNIARQVCCQYCDIRHHILEFTIEYYIPKTIWLFILHDEADIFQFASEGDTDLHGQSTYHGTASLVVMILYLAALLTLLGV